ncbi:protein kinase domain-containing protein [Streptomyces celluloflavus]
MVESRLIQGRYRLLERIGRGGMGEVWRSRDESLGRQVAVKCLKPVGPQHDASFLRVLRERFRREARVAAALQHRGITVVHDFGEDGDTLFLVMELLTGRNLSQLLDDNRREPLPVTDIVEIAEQLTAALAYTHEQAVVHRDLKPANIVRTADGTVKICDFGIARLGDDIGFTARLTGTGMAMGTPHYMSPEQIGAGTVDHRSDLYSLGCVLYEITTGVPPFDLGDAWAVLIGHRDTAPEPPRNRRPDLPEAYERIVLDLLAKDPDDRPRDAAELGKRLADARRPQGGHPTGAAASTDGAPGADGPESAPTQRLPSWTRGMTGGSPANGARPAGSGPPGHGLDALDALTDAWTRGPATRGEASGPPAGPAGGPRTTLAARHAAGLALGGQGRWAAAADVHRAVAAERARLLGPDHPDTLTSHFEEARALDRSGHPAAALAGYERVAAARTRSLGADHPDTLTARLETGHALGRLGRHFEAHQVCAAVLSGRTRALGPDHPDTLSCRHHLAFNLRRLGRLEDCHAMAREVAEARARVLGERHPETLRTRYEIAGVLGQLGRWEEALRGYREVADARAGTLGPDHPDTLAARYEVGIGLGRLGRSAEALALYRDLAAARTRVQGADDPETLRARHGLGVNLGRLGCWEEALAEAGEVAAARGRVLGADHPDTLVSRREVAVALGWLGRWADALGGYRQVADARERVLGAAHPDALASRGDQAQCLEQLGRTAEAVALYRRVATLRQERAARR